MFVSKNALGRSYELLVEVVPVSGLVVVDDASKLLSEELPLVD